MLCIACANYDEESEVPQAGEQAARPYEEDKMIGEVMRVEIENGVEVVVVGITNWERRDYIGDMHRDAVIYWAEISDETSLRHENGDPATLEDVKRRQMVLVHPPRGDDYRGIAEEIILLEMFFEEKYYGFLPGGDLDFKITVMFEQEEGRPPEMSDIMMDTLISIFTDRMEKNT